MTSSCSTPPRSEPRACRTDFSRITGCGALVKLNLTRALVDTLADNITAACETLERTGGASEGERERIRTGTGY